MYGDSTGLVRDCPVSSAGSRAGHAVGTVLPLLGQVERGPLGRCPRAAGLDAIAKRRHDHGERLRHSKREYLLIAP